MEKKYSTSSFMKFLTLGINRHAVVLNEETMKLGFTTKIKITNIKSITYETISTGSSWSYVYAFHLKNGTVKTLPYSAMEGKTFLELFNDLRLINPNIRINKEIIVNLSKPKRKLNFNFNPPPKGQRMSMDKAFGQQNPTLDAIFGFTIIFAYMLIPLLFYFLGKSCLISLYGINFETYRIVMFVLSGVSITTLLANLFIALASQYFGHKVTISSGVLTIIFAIIAII